MTAFLDTSLLVYAQTGDPKGETARQAILAGGVISVQVVNEFTAVLRRKFRLDWHAIAGAVADLRTALDPVRPVGIDTWASAVALSRQHRISFYDTLILASALEAGCDTLLTEDLPAGHRIDGLTIVNPFEGPE
ncbi:MAG: PIN domain-containing protein [Rhodospirillaceae bacterium]|nr:PIN domain-containing protein [Rhodospirillaceae bacterium]MYB13898.1 PIN domain-containing protein [Rhodospirillaceae bacterium]MYI50181.1 PIN domain-containing protein [Rhodospirillaceae bacterium]